MTHEVILEINFKYNFASNSFGREVPNRVKLGVGTIPQILSTVIDDDVKSMTNYNMAVLGYPIKLQTL